MKKPGKQFSIRRHGSRSAFTLLEVILAMTIVTMLVLMIANMFQEASQSWNIGTRIAEMNNTGRTVVEFIARELSQAVAGPVEAVHPDSGYPAIRFHLEDAKVDFVAFSGSPDQNKGRRALMGISFWLDGNELKYRRATASFDPYKAPPGSGGDVSVLIENILDFQLRAYSTTNRLVANDPDPPPYDSDDLPVCVDVYVEVLSADDAKKRAAGGADFERRNSRRYTTRVYFNNRTGWQGRP